MKEDVKAGELGLAQPSRDLRLVKFAPTWTSSFTAAIAMALMSQISPTAHAQAYPTKPIRYIVPFPPGGGSDLVARAVAQKLTETAGMQVFIDNRPGAGTIVGAEAAARSAPDGYTIFMGSNTTNAINPNLYPKLPYDTLKDFAPVTRLTSFPNVLVVHPSMPVRSVKELVAFAKARPGQLNFCSSGNGTPAQLAGVMFNEAAGVNIVHIPYKGSSPALTALMSGETQLMFGSLGSTLPFVKSGRLRALAVTSVKRSAAIPEMPTIAESGYPGFDAITWHGLLAPAGTPPAIIERLNGDVVKILRSNDFKNWLLAQGADAVPTTPEEFSAFMKSELALYATLVKKSGMKPD
jgi:tripartite-type tricarboxylate transporter receptor subunit TctC